VGGAGAGKSTIYAKRIAYTWAICRAFPGLTPEAVADLDISLFLQACDIVDAQRR
jgi:hypothetical protein